MVAQMDHYYELGIRALFPVHKFDNGFSSGDGHRTFSEFGSFVNSGQWSSYTTDCPNVPAPFDQERRRGGGNEPCPRPQSVPAGDVPAREPQGHASGGETIEERRPQHGNFPFLDLGITPAKSRALPRFWRHVVFRIPSVIQAACRRGKRLH